MATIKDLAREAGVSVATVSHVLNETRFVSPDLQKRVREACERLNYQRDGIAQSLRTKRSRTIALLIPDLANPYYPELARGVQDAADERGYAVILCNGDRRREKELAFIRLLKQRRVDGLVFNPSEPGAEVVELLRQVSLPVVLVGSRIVDPDFDVVMTDPLGAYEPVSYLVRLGHRRIGLIGGQRQGQRPGKFTGYVAALSDAGLPVDEQLVRSGDYTEASGAACTRELLAIPEPPTAVFAANDLMAIGALTAIREAGLRCPDDVAVIGYDDISQASTTTPRLTTVAVPKTDMGIQAAKLLFRRIDGGEAVPREQVVLKHKLVVRESSGGRREPSLEARCARAYPVSGSQGADVASADGSLLYRKVYGCLLGGIIGDAIGAPGEGKTYQQIQEQFGELTDFEGVGTDDTAIRNILCDAIIESKGNVTADEFAASFLRHKQESYRLWWVPVKNMFHKVESKLSLPVDAGWGNMQSSSSAMAISPMGILNACNPRQAAIETFDVAGLIHSGPSGFCRDAACGMAAAVAEAFKPRATVANVLAAAVDYLHPVSSAEIVSRVKAVLAVAREAGGYATFRERFYAGYLLPTASDSRETFPAALAIFHLAGGDPNAAIRLAANFGRDADTIATMVGGLVGALAGVEGLRPEWVARVEAHPEVEYRSLARRLAEIVLLRADHSRESLVLLEAVARRA